MRRLILQPLQPLPGQISAVPSGDGWYRIGAGNVGLALSSTKAIDITATQFSYSGANSTSNTTLTIENTSNAAAASHAILEIKTGGTTSTGNPKVHFVVPSGVTWYMGGGAGATGLLYIGTGSTVATNAIVEFDGTATTTDAAETNFSGGIAKTLNNAAGARATIIYAAARTYTLAGTTQVTADSRVFAFGQLTLAQSGGAVTVDEAAGITAQNVRTTTSVTLTDSSGVLVRDGEAANTGTVTRHSGLRIKALTRGTTCPQILLDNGSTEMTAGVADKASISCIDISAGNASFSFTTEHAVAAESILASTHVVQVRWNGTMYKILLSNV